MIRTRFFALFGGLFVLYWLLASDPPNKEELAFDPVTPSLVQVLDPPYARETPPSPVLREPAVAKKEVPLAEWLKLEAQKIGRTDNQPAATKARLKQKAGQLKLGELRELRSLALNREVSGDERFLAAYLLGLSDSPSSVALLKEVSLSEIPEELNDRVRSDEILVRTQALEGLVQKLHSAEAEGVLLQILERTSDPMMARHIQFLLKKRT